MEHQHAQEPPAEAPVRTSLWDGDLTALVFSFGFHLAVLVILGLIPLLVVSSRNKIELAAQLEEPLEEPFIIPEDVAPSDLPDPEIGAQSISETDEAISLAAIEADISEIPSDLDFEVTDFGKFEINHVVEIATATHVHENLRVRGAAGEGVTGVAGAVDRITQEILLSLEERKTLVVWMFDQSGSLFSQRQQIHDRVDRIYEELGVLEAAGNQAFAKYDKPLLTSVCAFGQNFSFRVEKTDNVAEVKAAIRNIELDETGVERVFSSVARVADRYKSLRHVSRDDGEPDRNVLIVLLTDEAGDDQDRSDTAVRLCRRYEIPVFVIGVPAPFGRENTMVKWVDPDPKFDQTPRWAPVRQGPESLMPERVKLYFAGDRPDTVPIDSGFGPFALTRLCYQSGGIYFTVHPNRNVNRDVGRGEVEAYASHIKKFFDPQLMRRYQPDYVSVKEYMSLINRSATRRSLLEAAQLSWVTPLANPRLRFVKRDEAGFVNELTEAQKGPARLEPQVERLQQVLKNGEASRPQETSLRWQAGFDLAYGRVLAVLVRTQSYNAMLAQAKRGMAFDDPKNNTWTLKPSDKITVSSKLKGSGDKAKQYLEGVVNDHPGTPWAELASRELQTPFGWEWEESFTDLAPPPRRANRPNNNNARPRPRRPNPAPPARPPRRPVPKL